MSRPITKLEYRFCKICQKSINFKKYRKVKPLAKGPQKGHVPGWTDINGGKRFTVCKLCENTRTLNKYRNNPIPQLISGYKRRAREKGVPFNLTPQDFKTKLDKAVLKCPVLGLKMQISKLGSKNNDLSPSIDPINPRKGYTKDNIIVVSMRANRIKTDARFTEIRKVADFYEKLLKN